MREEKVFSLQNHPWILSAQVFLAFTGKIEKLSKENIQNSSSNICPFSLEKALQVCYLHKI